MSLVVQVAGGPSGSAPPPAPPKGVVITATARGPPPAHSATPFSFHDQHVVQHHPQPAAGPPGTPPGYSRPLPMSPASSARPLPMSPSRGHGARTRITDPGTGHRFVVQHHQLPTQPLPLLSPGPAHAHTILGASMVNSPSLIPTSFMPRLPIHLTGHSQPPGVRLSPAPGPHHQHRSPLHVSGHQLSSSPAAQDTKILPPHAIRRLTRPAPSILHPDDDIEVGDSPAQPHPHHPRHRSLMSPKHNRKSLFTNLALQDHNYCAAPPPSPPRSPTPPVSPYTTAPGPHMGVALQAHGKDHGLAPGLDTGNVSAVPGSLMPLSAGSLTPSSPHPSIGGYPSPHYIGAPLASPRNRLKESLDAAGVGPMTPLGETDSPKDRSVSDNMEDGGEETETAPEAEDEGQDDSVTRCICDFTHDDGYMICCDKCSVWQHVVCMGLDKNNIPDEYLCEKCSPRPVDRKRAKALQKAIAKEQKERFARLRQEGQAPDSSDDEKNKSGLTGLDKSRKPFTTPGRKFGGKKALEKKLLEGKKLIKKTHKRRTHRDSGVRVNTESSSPGSPAKRSQVKDGSPRKSLPRRSLSGSDGETEAEESGPGETLSLRSWIDNYEEAVTNHYSPELRARLTGAKLPSNFFKPKDVSGIRCNVSLRGNGLKVLTANSYIPCDTAVIECRGKYMLNNPGLNKASRSNPYVLQHRLGSDLEVLVDGTTYGNDSRFCRRASPSTGESNAVIRHHLEKGSLHLYIVASRNIEKNSEILLPPLEKKNGHIEEEMSIADELREIKKAAAGKHVNGNAEGGRRKLLNKKRVAKREVTKKKDDVSSSDEDDDVRAEREVRIAKEKERLARQREQREKEREGRADKTIPRKTRSAVNSVASDPKEEAEAEAEAEVKGETKDSVKKEVDFKEEEHQLSIMIPKDKEGSGSVKNSPSIMSPALSGKSPTKPSLGLPDQSGLIVGVNTINYDVSFRNKTKTREERKMEMIMKAFEDMEKNNARKRNESETSSSVPKPEKKRRRSNSIKAGGNSGAGDSNLDQSSADEAYVGVTAALNANKKKGRTSAKRPSGSAGTVSSSRRRSRAKSGDSSALSEPENADEIISEKFKYPIRVSEDHDDDVSKQYIRGSRSPPGIANHLLRSARTDKAKEPVKSSGDVNNAVEMPETSSCSSKASIGHSAKKRWLMAAMSVDMTENEEGSGASPAAPASPELPDYTPLKKRRLAEYTNDSSEDVITSIAGDSAVSDKIKSLPNGLKKRLISNLVLEAVLDKAMEDYTPSNYNDEPIDSNNEDTSSPYINDMGDEEESEAMEPVTKPRSFRDKRKEAILQAEMDARSNNSSESEETLVNEARVQVRESFVPMKKCTLPANEVSETSPASPNPAPSPCVPEEEPVTNEMPISESLELSEPIRDQKEERVTNDVPEKEEREDAAVIDEESCSTPLQDEDTADSVSASVSVPSQHTVFKSFFSTDLSVEDIDRQLEAKREALVKEAMASGEASPMSLSDLGPSSSSQPQSSSTSNVSESASASVKKRMSLADYKKRKLSQVDSVGNSSGSQPTTPSATPITPSGLTTLPPLPLPSLPTLSLTRDQHETEHKHESRERSRHSSHRSSHSHSRPGSGPASRSPSSSRPTSETGNRILAPETEPEPREDLTERLRKEFGLTIDEDEDEPDNDNNIESLQREARNAKVNNVAKEVSRERREPPRSDKTEHRSLSSSSSKPSEFSRSSSKYSSDGLSSRSRDGGYSDKGYSSKYHDKRSDYRDSRDSSLSRSRDLSGPISIGYRDKARESRHHDKSRHGGRRPSHPSSPSSGPGGHRGMSLTNGGSGRRHHGSPSRRSSQDKESRYSSSHSSSGKIVREKMHEDKYNSSDKYYKSEASRRNFYPQ